MLITNNAVLRPNGVLVPCRIQSCCKLRRSRYRLRTQVSSGGGPPSEALSSQNGVISDSNVPEGHRGLHGALYGEGGAELHNSSSYEFRDGEDDGEAVMTVSSYLATREGERPLGVYAVYDKSHNIQYIGYSRNIVLALKRHVEKLGEDLCYYLRVMVFMNRAMSTRENLEREALDWIEREGTLPPGNGAEKDLWDLGSDTLGVSNMSDKERAVYEEKKNKLRKAMGENLHDPVPGESLESKERRLRLIKAVEGDNWSAVVNEQTNETIEGKPQEQIVSPFAQAPIHRSIGQETDHPDEEMTTESVDTALDEVRPYLIADGGNVEVVNVEDGNVFLRLQGACGTCPSSTATMKMGIERVLKTSFGDQLIEVIQVDSQDTSASIQSVNDQLDVLRPAIQGYGGSVEVLKVEDGVCELKYTGPAPIGMGIQAAIRDKFPDIHDVKLIS
eukprot:g4355.t1